jgi:dolichol-phosphate mannosyltransferase
MDCEHELVFVNDGSKDSTLELLTEAASSDPRVKVLGFSRNFGHQAAITAGLDFAAGDAVVVIDADLQDPPEILPDMVRLFQQGFDVVSAQRIAREGDGPFKRLTASLFYWIFRRMVDERIVPEVGDFRLLSRSALIAIRGFREQHRFMRGLVAWLGLKEAILPFHRQPRAAGITHYPFFKMLRFAWTAITSFSALPLRLSLPFGLFLALGGIIYCGYVVFALVTHRTVPGWASLVGLQVIFSGAILIAIGMLGDYVARIYEETKGRPLYVLTQTLNISSGDHAVSRAVVLPPREAGRQVAHR